MVVQLNAYIIITTTTYNITTNNNVYIISKAKSL